MAITKFNEEGYAPVLSAPDGIEKSGIIRSFLQGGIDGNHEI